MAGKGYNRAVSGNRQKGTGRQGSRSYTYIDGSTVRKLDIAAEPQEQRQQSAEVSAETRKNRERALQMNLGYVLFLTAAAVITVFVCVNFLQLRAVNTLLQEKVASLEASLDSAILENDSDYNRVMNSIDLEYVKEMATNELGMGLASSDQVITYDVEDGDYVRQYSEIPEE